MKGNQVYGSGTFTIDVYDMPEDEFKVICDCIAAESDRQTMAKSMQPDMAKRIKMLSRSLPRGKKIDG